MYKIGEFSILSKTTIKTLRYYEKEKLLVPSFIDQNTGYRYYETKDLIDLSRIISLRQVGMSIKDIKSVLNGNNVRELLKKRRKEIEDSLSNYGLELSKINYLLEEENMNNQIILKELPECTVYYKEGIVKNFSEFPKFIMGSAEECLELNPGMKCIEPDYCFITYLDGEYKETDFKIRYSQAVVKPGKENENIKFMKLDPVEAVCIYHKGSYDGIRNDYNTIMKYIDDNNYEVAEYPREHYIDGIWNKENEEDYLTEIQVPIKKK